MTNTNSGEQLFITTAGPLTIGIRMDRVLSFVFSASDLTLSIRYVGDLHAEKFEGSVAQAIFNELRYAGRK